MTDVNYRVYSKPQCPWCVKAARLLRDYDIPHEVRHVKSEYERAELAHKFSWMTFPIILKFPGGEVVGGFKELEKELVGQHVKEEAFNYPIDLEVEMISDVATLPTRGTPFSAGYDLSMMCGGHEFTDAYPMIAIHPGKRMFIHTGLKLKLPPGYYGRIAPRSGLAAKDGIDVMAGVIDEDYRGEIVVILINHGHVSKTFQTGDRVAQLILTPYGSANIVPVKSLDDTDRGSGGFGSTGS